MDRRASASAMFPLGRCHLRGGKFTPKSAAYRRRAVLLPPLLSLPLPDSQFPLCNDTAGTQTKYLRFVIQRSVDRLPLGAVRRRSHLILTLVGQLIRQPMSMFRCSALGHAAPTRDHQPYLHKVGLECPFGTLHRER